MIESVRDHDALGYVSNSSTKHRQVILALCFLVKLMGEVPR